MTAVTKVDLRKQLKHLYGASPKKPTIVDIPEMNFLMIDGQGDPNTSQEFQEAVEALYGLSYTLKFMIKGGPQAIDYPVMALEGLWWADDMRDFATGNKSSWKWTMMIMQPEWVTPDLVADASGELDRRKSPPALPKVRFEAFHEGLSSQVMYIGPYSDEGPAIIALHEFALESGYELSGKHHEIYIGDPRRAKPEKLKTIIRQPIRSPA
jgi:hypothetical protein